MDRFVTQLKNSTSTREIPSTSETTGKNASSEAAPAADVAADKEKRKWEKTRKYTDDYLKFGFTFKETDGIKLSVCHLLYCVVKWIYEAIQAAASLGDNPQPLKRQTCWRLPNKSQIPPR